MSQMDSAIRRCYESASQRLSAAKDDLMAIGEHVLASEVGAVLRHVNDRLHELMAQETPTR